MTWCVVLAIGWRAGLVSFRVDRATLRTGLRFGRKAQLGIVFVFLLLRLDQVMVQRILGFRRWASTPLPSRSPSCCGSCPIRSRRRCSPIRWRPRRRRLRLGYATARLALLLVAGAAAVAWVACPWLIRLAFGAGFDGAIWPFRLLLPGVVALAIQRPLAGVLLKRGRPGLVSCFGAVALAMNVAFNLLLLPRIGVVAASIGSSLAYLFLAVAYVVATRRSTDAPPVHLMPGPRRPASCSDAPSARPR